MGDQRAPPHRPDLCELLKCQPQVGG
jgi:hypothetical protein